MTYRGVARGKTIQLSEALPFPDGQTIDVSVELAEESLPLGSPALILRTMAEPPHLSAEDIDALECSIEEGKLPVPVRAAQGWPKEAQADDTEAVDAVTPLC